MNVRVSSETVRSHTIKLSHVCAGFSAKDLQSIANVLIVDA